MLARTSSQLEELHRRVADAKLIGFDTESSGPQLKFLKGEKRMINVYASSLTGYSLAFEDGTKAYVPIRHREGNAPVIQAMGLLSFVLSSQHNAVVAAQHWKHELLVARIEGIRVDCTLRDSELEAWLSCSPSDDPKRPLALKLLAKKYLGMAMSSFEQTVGQNRSFCDIRPEEAVGYATDDAVAALGLCKKFGPTLESWGLWDMYTQTEIPYIKVLRHMEDTGVQVDPLAVQKIQEELTPMVAKVRDEFLWLVGADVASPKSSRILYEEGHWSTEGIQTTKTGFKSDKGAVTLHLLRCKPDTLGYQAAKLKADFQMLNKILSTYTWKMVEIAQQYPDGRLHGQYHHTGTRTGRLSSSYPNMQQVPVRSELGKRVADALVAGKGRSLVAADMSAFEIRMLADLMGEGAFYNAFNADRKADPHMQTAKAANTDRQRAKVLLLAIMFRAKEKKLSRSLGLSVELSKEMIDTLYANMPEVTRLHERIIASARRKGYIKTLLGRRRMTPNIALKPTRDNLPLIWADERIACNTPIQGRARDVMTLCMVEFYRRVEAMGELERVRLGAQIHDDLRIEVADEVVDDSKKLLQDVMENTVKCKVPLVAEPTVGKTWKQLK